MPAKPKQDGNTARRTSTNPTLRFVKRIGLVTLLLHHQTGRYYSSHWDSAMNKAIPRSLRTTDLAMATKLAQDLDTLLRRLGSVGAAAQVAQVHTFTLDQALDLGISHSHGADRRIAAMKRQKEYFLEFMRSQFPAIKNWNDVLPLHIDAYCRKLSTKGGRREGKYATRYEGGTSARTQDNYLSVIRLTSRVLSENYPMLYRPISTQRMVRETKPKRGKHYLQPNQMLVVLEKALAHRNKNIAWMAVLTTWCGMRASEVAVRTTADFVGDTVRIFDPTTATGGKTNSSPRVVPLNRVALRAVRELLARDNVRCITGQGERICTMAADKLREYYSNFLHDECGLDIQPREAGRKSYANLLRVAGVQSEVRHALMGWAFRDVAGGYYEDWAVSPSESPEQAAPKLERLRVTGVRLVDEWLSKNSEISPLFPCKVQHPLIRKAALLIGVSLVHKYPTVEKGDI